MSDYGDLIKDSFREQKQAAQASTIGSIADNPDEAARAIELGDQTGVPPTTIYSDLDSFEQNHKRALAANIVQNNTYISDYINSHPMASKISNDDYGQLDTVSEKVLGLDKESAMGRAVKAWTEGYGDYPIGQWAYQRPQDIEWAKLHPIGWSIITGLGSSLEVPMRAFGGALNVLGEFTHRDVQGMAEQYLMGGQGFEGGVGGKVHHPMKAARERMGQYNVALLKEIKEASEAAEPFIKARVEPPVGVHPILDKIKAEEAKTDLKALDEALAESQSSKTKERNPEIFASFIRQHTNAKIAISGEAIRKLYGEKEPNLEDNILGWQSDLGRQLRTAEATGGDVEIPLADWLAKVDPKIAKELHDDIRVRPNGLTLNEAKEIGEREAIKTLAAKPKELEAGSLRPYQNAPDSLMGLRKQGPQASFEDTKYPHTQWVDVTLDNGDKFVDAIKGTNQAHAIERAYRNWQAQDIKPITEEEGLVRIKSESPKSSEVAAKPTEPEPPSTMREALREAYALSPVFVPNKKLKLELKRKEAAKSPLPGSKPLHQFYFQDEQGRSLGDVTLQERDGGKELYVAWIGAFAHVLSDTGTVDNLFGPRAMRSIIRQLQEEFPNAERITGDRISGARQKFGTEGDISIPLRTHTERDLEALSVIFVPKGWEIVEPRDYYPPDEMWKKITETSEARTGPFTEEEQSLINEVETVLNRIVPRHTRTMPVLESRSIEDKHPQLGFYKQYNDTLPLIVYSISSDDPIGTARHEAIHHLYRQGFFTREEWKTLTTAAEAEDWIGKHKIDTRYEDAPQELKIEEAIAEEFKDWHGRPDDTHVAAVIFQKLERLVEAIKELLASAFGYEPSVHDIFAMVETGEVGHRDPRGPPLYKEVFHDEAAAKPPQQLEMDVMTRVEDRDIFKKANAIGMTVKQYKRYKELISQRNREDIEENLKKVFEREKKEQTKEWKANKATMKAEVTTDIYNRPDIAADEFFRTGRIYGEKLKGRPKINSEHLTPEQKAAIPEDYLSKTGIHPDDAAGLFGYQSGAAMIERIGELGAKRKELNLHAATYLDKLINEETDRRMAQKYGKLNENIVTDTQDQILSQTQFDILHEETLAHATKAGTEFSFTKEQVKGWVQQEFNETPISSVSTDKLLQSAGKAGREAELALLEDRPGDAFKAKQKQYFSITIANEAKKLEKERGRFDRLAKRMSARELSTIDQEYTNFVHDILLRVGQSVKRSVQDLEQSIARGEQDNLADFVDYKQQHDLREMPVAEFLLDPSFRKPLDNLTVEEFRAVHDAIKTLVKNGRDEKKITKAGEEADLAEVRAKMIEQLQEFKKKNYNAEGGRWLGPIPPKPAKYIRTYLVSHLQLESLFNRWDRGDPRGVFTQYIMRELSTASNYEARLEREASRKLAALADKVDLKEKIDNNVFMDPWSSEDDPVPIPMTRKNLRAIMLNVGNKSNFDKLLKGYKIEDPQQVLKWINRHATKADWDWAQKIGDIFAGIKEKSDVMYRGLSGLEPESIPLEPFNTPHGQYKGWYYPIVYHPLWEGSSKKLMGGEALEGEGYVRATTPRGYTKQRTGYSGPLNLDLDQMPVRMRQMLHDIAFRPAVINAGKIFYSKDVRAAIAQHYGAEYRNMLVPYLRDVANSANFRSDAAAVGTMVSEWMRQNMIATLIGLNPGTVLKHGPTAAVNSITEVGATNMAKAVKSLFSVNEKTGETNWSFAMDTSEELQRRHRHYFETLGGAQEKVLGKLSMRESLIKLGSYPVAMSDLLSAVPTWLAKYESEVRSGSDQGSAIYEADRAVRRAHGSSVITNRPALMRGGPVTSWFTSLYGFFSHILNRQYELAWRAGDTLGLVKEGEYKDAMAQIPKLTGMFFSYVIFPALIEEMVTPMTNDEHESWGKKAAKALTHSLSSSWVYGRDIGAGLVYGRDPSAGLFSTTLKTVTDIGRDFNRGKETFSKEHAGNLIKHTATIMGAMTGLVNAQEGRIAQFMYNWKTGKERPKGPWQWLVGLRYGQTKGHTQSFNEWSKGKH